MSGHIDTSEGWREVDLRGEGHLHAIYQLAQYDRDSGELVRAWAQEVPVPPLPTEPYTVIRVTWKSGLRPDAREYVRWSTTWESEDNLLDPEELADRIAGFEVLAEPLTVTAKAVLDRIETLQTEYLKQHPELVLVHDVRDLVAREFRVEQ